MFGFKKKQKSIEHKTSNVKYENNAPHYEEDYEKEADALFKMIEEENVFNIGIVAPYGAGKSSLIKTFEGINSKRKKNKKHIAEVSLLKLCENSDNDNKKSKSKIVRLTRQGNDKSNSEPNSTIESEFDDSLLEKSVLEQLFFKEQKHKIPFSKIGRINNRVLLSSIEAVLIVLSILSALVSVMSFYEMMPWFADQKRYFYLFVAIASVLFAASIAFLTITRNIKKISIKNIEVEFENINNGSVLNLFLDEIIYFFKKSKLDVVIFEDIDRFDSIRVFTKLREINRVINDNPNIGKKITFIYCVSDGFFASASDRAKFFDFVISLMPVLGPKNADEHISLSLGEEGFSDLFILRISRFINEKRILNNIINDYKHFSEMLFREDKKAINEKEKIENDIMEKKQKLFAMMVYKNLFFEDYVKLQKGEGELVDLFGKYKNEAQKAATSNLESMIEGIQYKIDEISSNKFVVTEMSSLKERIAGIIAKQGKTLSDVPNGCLELSGIETFDNFKGGIYIRINVSVRTIYGNSTVNSFKYMDYDEITNAIGKSPFEIESELRSDSLESLVDEKTRIYSEILKISGMSMKDLLLKEYETKEMAELLEKNNFLSFAIRNGYIDESFFFFLGQYSSKVDSELIDNIISHKKIDMSAKVEKPDLVVEALDDSDFGSIYVLNYNLVSYLFNSKDNDSKKEKLLALLASPIPHATKFLVGYYLSGYDFAPLLMNVLKLNKSTLTRLFRNRGLSTDQKIMISMDIFERNRRRIIKDRFESDYVSRLIETGNHVLEMFIKPYLIQGDLLSYFDLFNIKSLKRLDYIKTENNKWNDIFIEAVESLRFDINYENIKTIETYYLNKNSVNVTNLLETSNPLCDFFSNNLPIVVSSIAGTNKALDESETVINKILTYGGEMSCSIKCLFVESLINDIDYIDGLEKELYEKIILENKMSKKWSNLVPLINNDLLSNDIIANYICKNIDSFVDKLLDKQVFLKLINDDKLSREIKMKIIKLSSISVDIDEVFDDELCSCLVDTGSIEWTQANLLKCDSKIMTLSKLLEKNNKLALDLRFNANDIEKFRYLVCSEGIDETVKITLIKNSESCLNSDVSKDKELCSAVAEILYVTKKCVVNPVSLRHLLDGAIINPEIRANIIEMALDTYSDDDAVELFAIFDYSTFKYIAQQNGPEATIYTSWFDDNAYVTNMIKRDLIYKSGNRAKINTRVNISKFLEFAKKFLNN